jgi:hypothetical protein
MPICNPEDLYVNKSFKDMQHLPYVFDAKNGNSAYGGGCGLIYIIVEECILLRQYTIKHDNHVTSLATI